jgi:hypothetical protein
MDTNKLKVLQEIGYNVPPHCGICTHADLSADGWGYCNKHTYTHVKHSEAESRLSIHRMGTCWPKHDLSPTPIVFELDHEKVAAMGLHAFAEFLPRG